MLKKLLLILTLSLAIPSQTIEAPVVEDVKYTHDDCEHYKIRARYYPSEMPSLGTKPYALLTSDGYEFSYETTEIDGKPVYDGMPVFMYICDHNSNNLNDFEVVDVKKDIETEIYDRLYNELSENEDWILTRNGNHIHIDVEEE